MAYIYGEDMRILALDPGYTGSLVIMEIEEDKYDVKYLLTPLNADLQQIDANKITVWLKENQFDHVYLEHVRAVFGSDSTSTFNFGRVFGGLEGLLGGLNLPFTLVEPKTWQKNVWLPHLLPIKSSEMHAKEKSLLTFQTRFPGLDVRPLSLKTGKPLKHPHDGVIDAVLIALYGFKQNNFDITRVFQQRTSSLNVT